jgi:hypothetical protein
MNPLRAPHNLSIPNNITFNSPREESKDGKMPDLHYGVNERSGIERYTSRNRTRNFFLTSVGAKPLAFW